MSARVLGFAAPPSGLERPGQPGTPSGPCRDGDEMWMAGHRVCVERDGVYESSRGLPSEGTENTYARDAPRRPRLLKRIARARATYDDYADRVRRSVGWCERSAAQVGESVAQTAWRALESTAAVGDALR